MARSKATRALLARENMLTYQQLQNDLGAARMYIRRHLDAETKFADQINTLRNEVRAAEARAEMAGNAVHAAFVERDDWRDAFKLIMRLVK